MEEYDVSYFPTYTNFCINAWLNFVDTYSNYSLGYKYLKIIEWPDLIGVIRVVVVDIPGVVHIEHVVRVAGIRGDP